MRHEMKKYAFIGIDSDRASFFSKAQEKGIVHFIDNGSSTIKQTPQEVQDIAQALKVLRAFPSTLQSDDPYDLTSLGIARQILFLSNQLDGLIAEERAIKSEMLRVKPFGDFSLEDLDYIKKEGKCIIQFYCAKSGAVNTVDLPEEVVYINSADGLDYFISFDWTKPRHSPLVEMIVARPWGILNQQHQDLIRQRSECEKKLQQHAQQRRFLQRSLTEMLNHVHLQHASNGVQTSLEPGILFSVEGWVPQNKEGILQQMIADMNVYAEEIAIDSTDIPPTALENTGLARIGEDLVHVYDTPSHTDKDPSMWLLVSFALFFAIIIGDGGYGLIMLLAALYFRNKKSAMTQAEKRSVDLITILSFSVIAWGVLTTSFFGITIAPDNPIRKVSLMSRLVEKKVDYHIHHRDDTYQEWGAAFPQLAGISDSKELLAKAYTTSPSGLVSYDIYDQLADNIMVELTLLVGVLHIIASMLRYIKRNPQNIGWIVFLIGAYLYTPTFLGAASILNFALGINRQAVAEPALYAMYSGVVLAVVIALFKHKWFGLLEATVVIQVFGDVLSYLRLYALGLSGALLTATMNEMASAVPLVFGIIILIFGHVINITLSVMGGVIHGLRLNFLEWYHYCFEGGGRVFNPLKKLESE